MDLPMVKKYIYSHPKWEKENQSTQKSRRESDYGSSREDNIFFVKDPILGGILKRNYFLLTCSAKLCGVWTARNFTIWICTGGHDQGMFPVSGNGHSL